MNKPNVPGRSKAVTGGAMPDVAPDIEDIYGYQIPGTDVIVWRGELSDDQWGTALLTHQFHRIQVDYFRYSVDGGKRLDEYLAYKERMQAEAAANPVKAPKDTVEKMARAASGKKATLHVPHEKLRHMHYPHLRKIAKAMGEDTTGTKDQVIDRILRAQSSGKVVPFTAETELTEA